MGKHFQMGKQLQMMTSAASRLAGIVGADAVVAAARLPGYAVGPFVPLAAVRPDTPEAVAATMDWAFREGIAVYPAGGRTFAGLGNPPARPGIILDLTRLNRLLDLQPADLTVSVAAGMTLARLDAALAPEGKHVPLGAPLPCRATVGGTLAAGVSGPLRAAYGLPRDWLIGVSVVGADGTPTKAGGKVVKNVTGYDLNRLYAGSLGTLGIITAATFKLAPAPTDWAVIAAAFHSAGEAVAAVNDLQTRPYAPLGLHIVNPAVARRLGDPDLPSGYGLLALAIAAGRPGSVQRRLTDTTILWLDAAAEIRVKGQDDAVSLVAALADLPARFPDAPSVSVRINAPPAALPRILELANCPLADAAPPGVIADAGFGGGRLLWWNDFSPTDPARIAAGLRQIQAAVADWPGDAIVERCPEAVKNHIDVWGPPPSGIAIMRRLKGQFDPGNILNPGRFIGGL